MKVYEEPYRYDVVTVLPSGLQYRVLKEGTGKQPAKTDSVVVHYKGTLVDGREFDSSYKRGEPANGVLHLVFFLPRRDRELLLPIIL